MEEEKGESRRKGGKTLFVEGGRKEKDIEAPSSRRKTS